MSSVDERESTPVSDASIRFRNTENLLVELGADSTAHVKADLLPHLRGTAAILSEWCAREDLRLAGLCHAAYGTDPFSEYLLPVSDRSALRGAIGVETENIVYAYCACRRDEAFASEGTQSAIPVGSRAGAVVREVVALSVSRVSPCVPV